MYYGTFDPDPNTVLLCVLPSISQVYYRCSTSIGGAPLVWGGGGVRGVWVRRGGVAPVVLRWCNLKEAGALCSSAHSSRTSSTPTTTGDGGRHGAAACRRHGRASPNAPSEHDPRCVGQTVSPGGERGMLGYTLTGRGWL